METNNEDSAGGNETDTADILLVKDLLDLDAFGYLDVRTVEEYERGHIDVVAKTVNVPYMFDTPQGRVKNPNFLEEVASFTKEYDGWLVGSETGVRSLHATTDLVNAGFTAINIGGGYQA